MHQDAPGSGEAAADPVNPQSKSKKKVEKKTIPTTDFFSVRVVGSWADEADEVSSPAPDISQLRDRLPTAPKVCREEELEARAPHSPPFQARMYNVPFEVTEEQIRNFLSGCAIARIITTEQRGQAVVEFSDRPSLVTSFKFSGRQLLNRPVRIDLNEQRQSNKSFYDNMNQGGGRRSYEQPGGNRGGYNRDFQHGGGQERGSFRGRSSGGGGFYNRDNQHQQQGGFYQPAGYHSNVQGGSESTTYQGFNSGYNRQRSGPPPALQLPSKASQDSQQPPVPLASSVSGPPTSNPSEAHGKRVNEDVLKSLLKSVGSEEVRDSKHNPFGAARPVDTLAKELEMEKRLEAERQLRAKQSDGGQQATSPGGPQGERPRHTSTGSSGQQTQQPGYHPHPQQQYGQQYGEQPPQQPPWQQGQQAQQGQQGQQGYYEGQQPQGSYASDYQAPYPPREQPSGAWPRQQQQATYPQGAELNKAPSFDRSNLEMIGRASGASARGGANGYQPQPQGQPQQPAPIRHHASGSGSDYRDERTSEQQVPIAPAQATMVPAPPPSSNPWTSNKPKPTATATVSAKTKQVTESPEEQQQQQYYQQPYPDYGDQYTGAGANYPYNEADEEYGAAKRQQQRQQQQPQPQQGEFGSPRQSHGEQQQQQTRQPPPPQQKMAWGGAGMASLPPQPQQQTPPAAQPQPSAWGRPRQQQEQEQQGGYQQQPQRVPQQQDNRRGYGQQQRGPGGSGGRGQGRNFYQPAEAIQQEQPADQPEYGGDQGVDQGGYRTRGRGGYNRGTRGGRGGRGGYRGPRDEQGGYEQGGEHVEHGGEGGYGGYRGARSRGQQGSGGRDRYQQQRSNRNSGTEGGEGEFHPQEERKRITSTSSSNAQQRERGDSHSGAPGEEGDEAGWNVAGTKKPTRTTSATSGGRGGYYQQGSQGKPRSSYGRGGEQGGYVEQGGYQGGAKSNAPREGGNAGRVFYSQQQRSGPPEGRRGGSRGVRGDRSDRNFAQGGERSGGGYRSERGVRGGNANTSRSQNAPAAASSTRGKDSGFEQAKPKKTTRAVSAKDAGVTDETEAERFLDQNKFELLEETSSDRKQPKVAGKAVTKDHFDGEEKVDEDAGEEEYEVEVEEEVDEEVEGEEEVVVKENETVDADAGAANAAASPSDIDYFDAAADATAAATATSTAPATSQGPSTAEVC